MSELKPCPFCGGEAYISSHSTDERFGYADQVSVGCKGCGVGFSRCDDQNPEGGYALKGTAKPIVISQWNTRADLALTTAQLMADPRVRALVEALEYYAPSEIDGVLYHGGDDSGRRAVKALAQLKEPKP